MFEYITNTITSPLVLATSTIRSFWDSATGAVSGLFSGGIKGGVFLTGVAALGTLFRPTIESAFESMGRPDLYDAIDPYLDTNGNMGQYLTNAFRTGAVVGGVLGAGDAAARSLAGGIGPVAAESQLAAVQQATNVGNTLGNGLVALATGFLAVEGFEHLTGQDLGSLLADTPASEGTPAPAVIPPR